MHWRYLSKVKLVNSCSALSCKEDECHKLVAVITEDVQTLESTKCMEALTLSLDEPYVREALYK